jgi:hypothetical protein
MPQATANVKLVDSLAQIILTLNTEERRLLEQKIRVSQMDLNRFFADLAALPVDPEQPSLEEISQTVREVRQELWAS